MLSDLVLQPSASTAPKTADSCLAEIITTVTESSEVIEEVRQISVYLHLLTIVIYSYLSAQIGLNIAYASSCVGEIR